MLKYHMGNYITNEHSILHPAITTAPTKHPVNTLPSAPPTYTLTNPDAITPQKPFTPCTENASSGSSTLSLCSNFVDVTNKQPDTAPMTNDHAALAASHPAVIPTRPANNPLDNDDTFSTLSKPMININVTNPPAAADNVVFMHTTWMTCELEPVAPKADPPLNPYHPNHSIRVPNTTMPTL